MTTRAGETLAARAAIVAVPLNTLRAIDFDPGLPADKQAGIALGQASRGIKLMIRAEGDRATQNAIRQGHEFGYLASEERLDADAQLLIGFGPDAERLRADDLGAVQRSLETIMPGYRAVDATAHDWLADEFSRGTWAIHRPGWYEHHHAAMRRPEGRVLLAGSDLANGWAGFIDGAIESRAARRRLGRVGRGRLTPGAAHCRARSGSAISRASACTSGSRSSGPIRSVNR